MSKLIPWKCPKCGAPANGHGKGGVGACNDDSRRCCGFLCECADETKKDHGQRHDDPCPTANCYHCGWGGTFPVPLLDPKKLKGWARMAWAAGWRPPVGWTPKQ